jgi:small subunit ribosomal protein S18
MAKKKTFARSKRKMVVPPKCYFCVEKKVPSYNDVEVLQRYITERGKIISRARSGLCAKHQNRLALAIKHARHLALLPFVGRD